MHVQESRTRSGSTRSTLIWEIRAEGYLRCCLQQAILAQVSLAPPRQCPSASRQRRARSTPGLMQLENRCLLSAFVPTFPTNSTTGLPMGTMQSQGLGSVLNAFAQDPNNPNPKLPAAKLITIMNNSSDVIFPIFYGANTTADNTAGQVVRVTASGGTGFTGTFNVTFSLGTGLNPVAATAVVAGNGNLYGVNSFTAGSGYKPTDNVTVASIMPADSGSTLGTGAGEICQIRTARNGVARPAWLSVAVGRRNGATANAGDCRGGTNRKS